MHWLLCDFHTDVKCSRPKWPRGQNFGISLGLKDLASKLWPWPGLDLVVLLCNRAFFGQNRVKFGSFVNFSVNNLKSYVFNHYLVLFHNYFWPRPWPQSPQIFLGLIALASASRL